MLLLGHIENKRAAQAFSDYLSMHKITHKVESAAESTLEPQTIAFNFYVEPTQYHLAKEQFRDFLTNPNQDKFRSASWYVGQVQEDTNASLGLSQIWRATGGVTKFVTLLCTFIYLASLAGYFGWLRGQLSYGWQLSELYRLITPAFLHFSALHIVFNLCWWWYLGGRVEKVLGKQTLLLLLVISAVISNTAQAILVNANFGGLSGVNYALVGFAWYCGAVYKSNTLMLPTNIFVFMLVWMLLGFADVLPISMANWAHLFGLLSGLLLARILVKPEEEGQPELNANDRDIS